MPDNADDASAALLSHPYGIFLVGSRHGDEQNLMTATWGTQCSFDPRLYSVFIEKDSHTRKLIDGGGVFTICLLPVDVEDVVSQYTKPAEVVGSKLGEYDFFDPPQTGAPVDGGSLARFECRVVAQHDSDSHVQYMGEVLGGAQLIGDPAWTVQQLGWEYGG